MFLQAQAFGFPVVPDVYTNTAKSLTVAFAGGGYVVATGSSFILTTAI